MPNLFVEIPDLIQDIAAYCLEKMEHNASPRDNAGYTPLHEACSKGRLDIARLLLQYGADPSDSAQGGIRYLIVLLKLIKALFGS